MDDTQLLLLVTSRNYAEIEQFASNAHNRALVQKWEPIVRNIAINYMDAQLLKSYPFKYRIALHENAKNLQVFKFLLDVLYRGDSTFLVDIPDYVYDSASEEVMKLLIEYKKYPSLWAFDKYESVLQYLKLVPHTKKLMIELLDWIDSRGDDEKQSLLKIAKDSKCFDEKPEY